MHRFVGMDIFAKNMLVGIIGNTENLIIDKRYSINLIKTNKFYIENTIF